MDIFRRRTAAEKRCGFENHAVWRIEISRDFFAFIGEGVGAQITFKQDEITAWFALFHQKFPFLEQEWFEGGGDPGDRIFPGSDVWDIATDKLYKPLIFHRHETVQI